jgi:hypothetical protein
MLCTQRNGTFVVPDFMEPKLTSISVRFEVTRTKTMKTARDAVQYCRQLPPKHRHIPTHKVSHARKQVCLTKSAVQKPFVRQHWYKGNTRLTDMRNL